MRAKSVRSEFRLDGDFRHWRRDGYRKRAQFSTFAIAGLATIAISNAVTASHASNKPELVATDFCKAVAAQARCTKVFTMASDTEAKLEKLAGSKLRGDGVSLNPACQIGYSQYYALEDSQGKDKACQTALREFGPEGARRAGLLSPRAAPKLNLAEAEVSEIVTDLCYAMSVAEACPQVSLTNNIQTTLSTQTGADLSRPGVGYFSSECGSGTFRAGLAKGKVKLNAFCAAGLKSFGDNGSKRAGLLAGELSPTPSTAKKEAAPADNAKAVDETRVILTEVPPLEAGQTPESLFGRTPAIYSDDLCEQMQGSLGQALAKFNSAPDLAKEIRAAIHLKAGSEAFSALCPTKQAPSYSITTAAKVKDTGLEACHLVMNATKEIDKLSKQFRETKFLRGMLAVNETKVWALKEFLPGCSKLTNRQMASSLSFAEKNLKREKVRIGCRIWYDAFRGTMKAARKLQSDKNWEDAFVLVDNQAAGAVHGVVQACGQESYAENAKKQWVSTRQYIQQRALR